MPMLGDILKVGTSPDMSASLFSSWDGLVLYRSTASCICDIRSGMDFFVLLDIELLLKTSAEKPYEHSVGPNFLQIRACSQAMNQRSSSVLDPASCPNVLCDRGIW